MSYDQSCNNQVGGLCCLSTWAPARTGFSKPHHTGDSAEGACGCPRGAQSQTNPTRVFGREGDFNFKDLSMCMTGKHLANFPPQGLGVVGQLVMCLPGTHRGGLVPTPRTSTRLRVMVHTYNRNFQEVETEAHRI